MPELLAPRAGLVLEKQYFVCAIPGAAGSLGSLAVPLNFSDEMCGCCPSVEGALKRQNRTNQANLPALW